MKSLKTHSKDIAETQQDATEVICNYQDNYYGDQVCVAVTHKPK